MTTREKLDAVLSMCEDFEEAYGILEGRPDSPVDNYFKSKIDEWANKIYGISSGYEAEFNQMYKHRIEKARPLIEGHADVTIGEADDIHAKSVQLKSTVQDDHSAVNTMIKVALNQLSGERGELPRPGDRRIVDMHIQNPNNTWPGGRGTLGNYDWNQFVTTARQKLADLITNYRPHSPSERQEGYGLSPEAFGLLTDVSLLRLQKLSETPFAGHGRSSQVVSQVYGQHRSVVDKVIHLTIKIRYHFGYPIISGYRFGERGREATYRFLHLAVFNGVRAGNKIIVNLTKFAFYDPDIGYVSQQL